MLIHNINYTIQQPLPSSYTKNEYSMNYRKKEGKKRKKNIFYVKVTLEEKKHWHSYQQQVFRLRGNYVSKNNICVSSHIDQVIMTSYSWWIVVNKIFKEDERLIYCLRKKYN